MAKTQTTRRQAGSCCFVCLHLCHLAAKHTDFRWGDLYSKVTYQRFIKDQGHKDLTYFFYQAIIDFNIFIMICYFGAFDTLEDFLSFCFNDWIKVWRLALASKMKILSWNFVGNFLLSIATNSLNTVLASLIFFLICSKIPFLVWTDSLKFRFIDSSKFQRLALT